jgi:hypothetical protein
VSPDWKELDHSGAVSARVFPGSSVACPYLTQGSIVKVRRLSSVVAANGIGDISETRLSSKRPREELPPHEDELDADGISQVTPSELRTLKANFRSEAKQARSAFKNKLSQEWHRENPSIEDKENSGADAPPVATEGLLSDAEYAFDYFASLRMGSYDELAADRKATFIASLVPRFIRPDPDQSPLSVRLRQERVKALWEGLRRRFFQEDEATVVEEASLQADNRVLQREIAALMERLRRRGVRIPDDPPSISFGSRDDESDNPPPGMTAHGPQARFFSDLSLSGRTDVSRQQSSSSTESPPPRVGESSSPRRSRRLRQKGDIPTIPVDPSAVARRRVSDRYFYQPVPSTGTAFAAGDSVNDVLANQMEGKDFDAFSRANNTGEKDCDALSRADNKGKKDCDALSRTNQKGGNVYAALSRANNKGKQVYDAFLQVSDAFLRAECDPNEVTKSFVDTNGKEEWATPRQLVFGNDVSYAMVGSLPFHEDPSTVPMTKRKILLSLRTLRKVLAAKETLFKFGTFVPRNESEALRSPEASRWIAGRDLEWLRMGQRETFARDWTWNRIQREFPEYKKSDIGHLFYVFDYKYSGEHRVRLVFDGSRQSPSTYTETYAPAARQESVRLFHIILVEEGYLMGQYDVPQAFLLAPIDTDIFVYPPNGQSEYPGQILKLRKALYGGKQSAFLWFSMINAFILELGFVSSPMDSCLYRRHDAILILYCDDLRIGATSTVLTSLQAAFFTRFQITTAPGDRFFGNGYGVSS